LPEFDNCRRWNSGGTGIRQHPATEILLAPKSGDIQPPSSVDHIHVSVETLIRLDLDGSGHRSSQI
jgi:hypothetical protein